MVMSEARSKAMANSAAAMHVRWGIPLVLDLDVDAPTTADAAEPSSSPERDEPHRFLSGESQSAPGEDTVEWTDSTPHWNASHS